MKSYEYNITYMRMIFNTNSEIILFFMILEKVKGANVLWRILF